MKKIISTVLVCVLLLGCVMSLTSCTLLMGKYEADVDVVVAGGKVTYEFLAFKYTKTTTTEVLGFEKSSVEEGTFKVAENDEGELTITFTYEVDGEEKTETAAFSQGEEDGVKYVKIGLVKYTKAD